MAMSWYGENKHYLWGKIQLSHISNTAKLAGLAKETVEEILNGIRKADKKDKLKVRWIFTALLL
ncbi:hypothetical protein [Aggregatibacter actinomycetemcomitans]|uniref:hypothetical protein n=1 Tax=Aggregatibacter actinomycetemcomitans TaxID=714 RepID=UPI001F11D461|nr:hypothetical protein [Aggregatibacter actinomycetemcomitans]